MEKFLDDLISSDAFRLGLVYGGVAAAAGAFVALLWRKVPQPPIGGLLYTAVTAVVLRLEFGLPWRVVLGMLLLIGGVMLGTELWDRLLGAIPGAIVLVYLGAPSSDLQLVLTAGVAVCAALVVDFDAEFRRTGMAMPLLAGAAIGVLMTVPDTERAFALVGAALPLAFTGWPWRLVSLGPGGAAAVGLFGWVATEAGAAREGAAIGVLASLGLMLGEPVGRRLAKSSPNALLRIASAGPFRSMIVIAIHGVLVFGGSRIAGLQTGVAAALALALVFVAIGAGLGAAPDVRNRGRPAADDHVARPPA
jgi:hypothetical protein